MIRKITLMAFVVSLLLSASCSCLYSTNILARLSGRSTLLIGAGADKGDEDCSADHPGRACPALCEDPF